MEKVGDGAGEPIAFLGGEGAAEGVCDGEGEGGPEVEGEGYGEVELGGFFGWEGGELGGC